MKVYYWGRETTEEAGRKIKKHSMLRSLIGN